MVLKISLCFLALVVNISSSAEYSGLLSRLYKKAASENRPLILVLDNSLKGRDEPLKIREESRAVKPRDLDVDLDKNLPVSILDLLNQKRQPLKVQKRPLFDHPITDHKHRDLHRLKYRLEKEQRERRERRERKNRAQYRDEDEDRDDERNQNRNRDEKRERYLEREDDREDRRDRKRDRNQDDKRALRSSVIKNLLRTYNDLNCEAKDECQDDCNSNFNGKKKDKCEDKCEVKYECEESEKEDPCKEKDQCEDSEEFTSTKGERLVTVTEKCKRC